MRADVESAIVAAQAGDTSAMTATPVPPNAGGVPPEASIVAAEDEQVPLSSIRRITAQRLTESAAVPHFYLTSVVDAGALLALRADLNAALAETAPKVSITDLLIRACAVTLRGHPQVNSSWAVTTCSGTVRSTSALRTLSMTGSSSQSCAAPTARA